MMLIREWMAFLRWKQENREQELISLLQRQYTEKPPTLSEVEARYIISIVRAHDRKYGRL